MLTTTFIFGIGLALAIGSFANVCVYRIPRGISLWSPRSFCPSCGGLVPWRHNIPLLSFFLLKGRCGKCRHPIGWRYPVTEAVSAAAYAVVLWRHIEQPALLAVGGIFTFLLIVIAFIDGEHQIIPDVLSYGLLLLGLAACPWNTVLGGIGWHRWINSFQGAAMGFGLMMAISILGKFRWKKEALGGGDVKLMAGLGTLIGWKGVVFTLLAASILGSLWAGILWARRKIHRGDYLPFGPFLAGAAWLYWVSDFVRTGRWPL